MIVYKAYHGKLGWSRDYKRTDGKLAFNFGEGYYEDWDDGKKRMCVGFQLLSDEYNIDNKRLHREEAIADLLDEDHSTIFTDHYYTYPKPIKINYYTIENPLFLVKYKNGVFYYVYEYGKRNEWIPISYVDSISDQYIEPELLELVGNIYDDWNIIHNELRERRAK
jgi:hypothetical protein